MSEKIVVVFTLKQRMEIERIAVDEDKESALAFAVRLSEEETDVMKCKELFSDKFAEKRKLLTNILKDAGYTVPGVFAE